MRPPALIRLGVLIAPLVLLSPAAFPGQVSSKSPTSVRGTWQGTAKAKGQTGKTTWVMDQTASSITGTLKVDQKAFSSCGGTVSGTLSGSLANQELAVTLVTPHLNPTTCQTSGTDISPVNLAQSSNVKLAGSFQQYVPELDEIVTVVLNLKKVSAATGIPVPADSHDLAVTRLKVPRTVSFKPGTTEVTRLVRVRIQNRGNVTETLPDFASLDDFVTLTATPVGAGPEPSIALVDGKPQKSFPITLKPKKQVDLVFSVTFTGASDPAKTTKQESHDDLVWTAQLQNHSLLDGHIDLHPGDDDCPREVPAPYDFDFFPDGKLKDKGCGTKLMDGTFGGDVLTDIVIK